MHMKYSKNMYKPWLKAGEIHDLSRAAPPSRLQFKNFSG